MYRKGKLSGMEWLGIIAIVIAAIFLIPYLTGKKGEIQIPSQSQQQIVVPGGKCEIATTTLSAGVRNYINGSAVTATAANIVYNSLDSQEAASVTIDAYPDDIGSAFPATFNGYIMTGSNGNYYFTKTPVSWDCVGKYSVPQDIRIAPVSSVTWTGYDDGVAESTLNITVGTSKVTSTEIKIASDSDKCIGNPNLANPIMVCVNGSSSTLAKFNEIKPMGVTKSSYVPGFLSDQTSVKGCYILPINALCDGAEDRRYWVIDPVSDPGVSDKVSICLIDKDYYPNDNQVYVEGWEDISAFTSNSDIGIPLTCITVNFT